MDFTYADFTHTDVTYADFNKNIYKFNITYKMQLFVTDFIFK